MPEVVTEKLLLFAISLILCISKSIQNDFVVMKDSASIFPRRLEKRQVSSDFPKIKEFHVITNVANRFAETTIISKVENADNYAKQTAFSVVLPERAFISGFTMEIDGSQYTAFLKEKNEAKRLFGQSISTGQTAGHVEVSARYSNRFTVNVNIEPNSKVIFNLTYEELLQRENGQYEIITNIQPGQIVKKLRVQVNIRESQPLSFVRVPYLRSGNNEMLQYNANLDPHARVKIYNTSAFIIFEPDVARQLEFACAGLGNKEYDGFAGQFVVKYDVNRTSGKGETIYQDGIVLSFYAPSPKSFDPLPKHLVFVLDTSGSMEGQKIEQLKDAMLAILPQLNKEDLFSIVSYATFVSVWDLEKTDVVLPSEDPELLPYGNLASRLQSTNIPPAYPATEENIEKMKTLIEQINPTDLTNSIGALEIGLFLISKAQLDHPKKYQSILVFLTDGLPNVGSSSPEEIINKTVTLNKANYNTPIYALCFGEDADWEFLRNMSLKTDGFATKIPVHKDSSVLLQNFYKKISTPLLSNVKLDTPEFEEGTRTNFKIFFNGTELVFAAKGVSGNNTQPISISARAKDGPVNLETQLGIPLTKLETVYAYMKVKELADQYHATGDPTLHELGLKMALKYSLVSEFTSLVVTKPGSQAPVETEDASIGIFPEDAKDLPLCQNITDWIINKFGTTESPTNELSTETDYNGEDIIEPVFTVPTIPSEYTTTATTTTTTTTTNELSTETDYNGGDIIEPVFTVPTITSEHTTTATTTTTTTTTTEATTTTTTEKIITCAESAYGCCYDGATFANGPNADGCDPVPKSESCSLPADRGTTCSNVTTKWFYSTRKHNCRLFRYGGCGGNENRFSTKEVCDQTCVTPKGKERCKLPISLGGCNRKKLRWFYDKDKKKCVKYLFGGCYGNSNQFNTKMECLKLCNTRKMKETIKEACYQPKDEGHLSCRRFEKNYYFDKTIGQCTKFWFSGCGGNDNRFPNKDACEKMCIYSKIKAICNAPPQKGSCQEYYPAYYYDPLTSSCQQFIYGGCGGNKNKFSTKAECDKTCVGQ